MLTMLGARHLVMLGDETFETGGALWFSDLTVADPTYVLPAVALASTYMSLEVCSSLQLLCVWHVVSWGQIVCL